jgi:hypothetical protein
MKIKSLLMIALLGVALFSCKKKDTTPEPEPVVPNPLPVVTTAAISFIGPFNAFGGGAVSSEGTSALTHVGVCWDTNHDPTTLRPHTDNGAGVGTFTSNLINLSEGTVYYVRAYATNATGTAYGNEVTFTTAAAWTLMDANVNNHTCFFATGTDVYTGGSAGVLRSADDGATWVGTSLQIDTRAIIKSNNVLLAATSVGGVYSSSSNGTSWATANNGLTNQNVYSFAVMGNTVLAATPSGVFRSSDDGQNWSSSSSGLTSLQVNAVCAKGNKFFAGTWGGLFVSNDFGANWSAVNGGGATVASIVVNGNNIMTSTYNTGGIYCSTDDGVNWTSANTGINQVSTLYLAANANRVYCGGLANTGVFMSVNSGTGWTQANEGLSGTKVYGLGCSAAKVFVSIYNSGIYRRSS